MPDPEPGAVLPVQERLRLFLDRLAAAEPATNAQQAFEQLSRAMDEVEDAHSGIPKEDNPGLTTKRMYPPRADLTWNVEGGGIHAITKGNFVNITEGGTISILRRDNGAEIFSKPGAGEVRQELDPELRKIQQLGMSSYPADLMAGVAAKGHADAGAQAYRPAPERGEHGTSR